MQHHTEHTAQPLKFRTRHGQLVAVRPATPADTFLVAELLGRLSERTRQLRYMSSRHFSAAVIWSEAMRMTQGQPREYTTLVATIRPNKSDEAVGIAELARDQADLTTGEIALVVRDGEQRQGIGSCLLRQLIRVAYGSGVTSLSANMLAENSAMRHMLSSLGLPYTITTHYGETQVQIALQGSRRVRVPSAHQRAA